MAEIMKEEPDIEEIYIKEKICIQEEILPSFTVEDTCTVYLQEEDVKMKFTEIKGKNRYLGLLGRGVQDLSKLPDLRGGGNCF